MEVARKPTSFLENFTTYLTMSMSLYLVARVKEEFFDFSHSLEQL